MDGSDTTKSRRLNTVPTDKSATGVAPVPKTCPGSSG